MTHFKNARVPIQSNFITFQLEQKLIISPESLILYAINEGSGLIEHKLLAILSPYTKFKLNNFIISNERVSYDFDAVDIEADKCIQFVYKVVSLLWDVEMLRYRVLDELIRTLRQIHTAHNHHFKNV